MSSPSLSSLSAETARLDRQAASRAGRDEDTSSGKAAGAGSFSGLLDQARLSHTPDPADSASAQLQRQLQARASAPSRVPVPSTQSQNQRPAETRPADQRQLDQRRAEARQASGETNDATGRSEVDEASASDDAQDGNRTDPSAASGATPTWLMHTVVRASLRGGAPGGDASALAASTGPGSGGTGDAAPDSLSAATATLTATTTATITSTTAAPGGWAGARGEPVQGGATDAPGLEPVGGGHRGKGAAPELADVAGKAGPIALDESFQSVPGQESFAAQLAAQATAAAPQPVADGGAAATRLAEAQIDTPVDAPGFGEAVMHKVVHLAKDGAQDIKLHLNPIEMGPIQIRIAIESGQARIEFGAAAEATRQALEQAMPALAQSLQADGLNLAAGSGVAPTADPTLASLVGQQPGGAMAQSGGGQSGARGQGGQSGQTGTGELRGTATGRSGLAAPVGHELRTGWAGTPSLSNGALRALDLYA